ncbi:MAG: LemA family protein [Thermodesulfobacteriota bacterium]
MGYGLVWIASGVSILLIIAVTAIHYGFTVRREAMERAWLELEKALRSRHDDRLPRLIHLASEDVGADAPILSDLMIARGRAMGVESITSSGVMESSLTREVRRLFAFLKSYPAALENGETGLAMALLRESEREIGEARRSYNALVTKFNNRRESFPSNLVAVALRVRAGEYFQTDETPQELIALGHKFIPHHN